MNYQLPDHARQEMHRRNIPLHMIESVLSNPQQVVPADKGRKAYQSKLDFGGGKIFLLRVIVDDRVDPMVVVTMYRTSKIDKYWSQP